MSTESNTSDLRLIEHGFPCHQVGAETRRERNASSALPPLYFLHVWWARRPLTPSRAAILASLAPADADVETFLKELGIEKEVVRVGDEEWVMSAKLLDRTEADNIGKKVLPVDAVVIKAYEKELERRRGNRALIAKLRADEPFLNQSPILRRWEEEVSTLPSSVLAEGQLLPVYKVVADPAWANERIAFETERTFRTIEDKYGYGRAYKRQPVITGEPKVVLDPTSGGGSIPFEAMRLGHKVIANELNPVATVILHATLDYPARYGLGLLVDIEKWGNRLRSSMVEQLEDLFPASPLLAPHPELDSDERLDGFLYTRTVKCPHCGGDAPLMNTCWLAKKAGDQWGVKVLPQPDRTVKFETYRAVGSRGPNGEDPESSTVTRGVGQCIHCQQGIEGDEIKAQARGESPRGKWWNTLYAVAAVRFEPVLDSIGKPVRYKSGERKGEIKTKKMRFFRAPNQRDLDGLEAAERRLAENWEAWDSKGLIPTESIPEKSNYNRGHRMYGMIRWSDMFTPRQLLGHVTLIEQLNVLKPAILDELGDERGRAVVTYLQFAIDKGIDYNSAATRWEYTRGIIKGTFSRHNYSLQWLFGEMIFTGPSSGAAWGLSQVLEAYAGIADLLQPVHERGVPELQIINGSAAHMEGVESESVDLICVDPPYYDNVLYAELSDFFYVWNRRTLRSLYPDQFSRRLTNKADEVVASRARDGSGKAASKEYERLMTEIFTECSRALKPSGIMTMMFTHKTQDAWETLTKALIESGWNITAAFPVDSESGHSTHQMDVAAAASSIFIACRKRPPGLEQSPATWMGFGGTGVAERIRESVRDGLKDFAALRLNPVDEMVASYGRALRVLSENWPVLDGDEPVTPIRAMNEASRVVAENQITKITKGQLSVGELSSEGGMCLTLFGIFGHAQFPYDEALNLSKSLNISLVGKGAGYEPTDGMIGINTEEGGRGKKKSEEKGYFAPLLRKGSKLRLAKPEERNERRLKNPQTEWDVLHGLLLAFREGGEVVARSYLEEHADGRDSVVLNLLKVWEAEIGDQKLQKEARALAFGLGVKE